MAPLGQPLAARDAVHADFPEELLQEFLVSQIAAAASLSMRPRATILRSSMR